MALGSLVVNLGLNAAEFVQGLSKAEQQSKRFADKVARDQARAAADIQAQMKAIGTAVGLAAAAGVVGLGALVKSSIDAADHLNDLSKKTGIAVDTLGGIGFAASQAGGDLESAQQAAGKLNKSLAEAAAGNKQAAEGFDVLGIAVKDAAGNTKSADKVMIEIADKFARFEDGPEKAAIALRIFGKAGADQIAVLNDGGKALQDNIEYYKRFGGVTAETAAAADQFNDTLGKSKLLLGSFGRTLAAELLPGLQAIADAMLRVKEESNGISAAVGFVKTIFETLVVTAANVAFVFQGVGREIGAIAAQMAALARLDFKGFTAISDAVKEDGVRARKELDAFERRVMGLDKGLGQNDPRELARRGRLTGGAAQVAAPRLPPTGGGDKGPKVSEAQRYLESLQKQLEKTQELTVAQQTAADIEKGRIAGLTPLLKAKIVAMAEEVTVAQHRDKQLDAEEDQLKRFVEFEKQKTEQITKSSLAALESLDTMAKSNAEIAKEIELLGLDERQRVQVENAHIQTTIALKEEVIARREAAGIGEQMNQVLQREVDLLKERQKVSAKKADLEFVIETEKKIKDTADQANKTLSESIADGLLDGFRKGSSFADIFLNELKAQFAKTILAPQIQPIVKAGNDLIGQIINGILGSFGGGSAYAGGIGGSGSWGASEAYGMSGGGPVSAGGMYRVNERRTEALKVNGEKFLLMGAQGGNIDSNPRMGGAAPVIYQTLNVGQGVSRNELAAAMVQAKEEAKAEISRSMRFSNGQFAN